MVRNGQATPIYRFITDIDWDDEKKHSSLSSQKF